MKEARVRREGCLAPGARGLRDEGHTTFESSEDVAAVTGDLGGGR